MKLKKNNSRSNGVIFDADMLVTRYLYVLYALCDPDASDR